MQIGIPYLPGPAPSAQNGSRRQALTNACAHLMTASRRTTGAIAFTSTITRGRNRETEAQARIGKPVERLVSDRDMEEIEVIHGRLA